MEKEYFSKEVVCEALDKVVHDLTVGGLYAPMMRRIKVRIDDSRPESMKKVMGMNGSPMCTDGQTIGVSIDNLHKIVNSSKNMWLKEFPSRWDTNDCYAEIRNIMIHELTHAICRHSDQGLKVFTERYQKSHKKTLNKELACWSIACEIEANRGHGIIKYNSPVYYVGVTEDKYPESVGVKYLVDIFHKVLENYKDQVEEDMKAIQKALEEAQKESQKNDGKKEKENPQQGDCGEETDGDTNPEEQDGGSESDSQSGQSGSQQPLKLGENADDQARREALLDLLKETLSDTEEGFTPEMMDPDAPRDHETVFEQHGNAYSHGGDDVDGTFDATQKGSYEILEPLFEDWKGENIKRAMAKLKGTVIGQVSKNRVSTYSRQARRDTSDGLLKKGHRRERRSSPKILLALDKSGSMSQTSTQRATEAVAEIFDTTGRPTEGCFICLHDGCVRMVNPMKQWKTVVQAFIPNGGNDFTEVIKLANKLKVDVVLNVGDGGDYTYRDKSVAKEFEQAGRKWYDVSIVNIGREGGAVSDHERWWNDVYHADANNGGITRHFIDLTGFSDFGDSLDKIFDK